MRAVYVYTFLTIACVLVWGCKPKLTLEQQRQAAERQRQQEERWRKVDEYVAQSSARDAQRSEENAAKHHKLANASVSYDDYNVRIKNNDAVTWPELNVYINAGIRGPLSGYGIRLPAIESGKSITVPLRQFTKATGERFSPTAYRVTELWIGGGDYDYQKLGAD